MNIFILSWCVKECAAFHFDRHVVKMILELAQILSTVHYMIVPAEFLADYNGNIYKPTNKKHPCCLWAAEHIHNYRFVIALGLALCEEYTFRYGGKTHKTEKILKFLAENEPNEELFCRCDSSEGKTTSTTSTSTSSSVVVGPWKVTEPAQAMPERFKVKGDVISAYMQYYHADSKAYLRSWKKREIPFWFDETIILKTPLEHITSKTKRKQIEKYYLTVTTAAKR